LAEAIARSVSDGPYLTLAQWLAAFVHAEAARLNVTLEPRPFMRLQVTPPPQPMNCGDCPLAESAASISGFPD